MPSVKARDNEYFDQVLRRFKKAVERADTINDVRKKEFYEKPTTIRKRAKAVAVKRTRKQWRDEQLPNQSRKY